MPNRKRILSVSIIHACDESPDTSYLGEYSNRAKSEYAIDRAHSETCASVREDIKRAKITLEHAQQTVGDLYGSECQNCGKHWRDEQLKAIEHLSERVAPGEAMPSGECPECGAVCHLLTDPYLGGLDDAYNELGELIEDLDACDCDERVPRNSYRYFNGCVENYAGESPEDIRKYVRQDYERMERLNAGDWCFMCVYATAEIQTGSDVVQQIRSGGLWGIESDSERAYFEEVQKDELAQLRAELTGIGFSSRAISSAIKSAEVVDK